MGVVEEIDYAALSQMCRWWAVWRKADEELDDDPSYQATIKALVSWKAFDKLGSQFGLTPTARVKLATTEPDEPDPLMEILRGSIN